MEIADTGDGELRAALDALATRDRDIARILALTGLPPSRRRKAGFGGLARVVVAQQVSAASAAAIWSRIEAATPDDDPDSVLGLSDEALRAAGLSAPKIRTLRALAGAAASGALDLDRIPAADAGAARRMLCAIRGIGPWSADIYLLFCHGHPDIWPAGDLALQTSVAHALVLPSRPGPVAMEEIAARWRPLRSAAAQLFWAYHAVIRGRANAAPHRRTGDAT